MESGRSQRRPSSPFQSIEAQVPASLQKIHGLSKNGITRLSSFPPSLFLSLSVSISSLLVFLCLPRMRPPCQNYWRSKRKSCWLSNNTRNYVLFGLSHRLEVCLVEREGEGGGGEGRRRRGEEENNEMKQRRTWRGRN